MTSLPQQVYGRQTTPQLITMPSTFVNLPTPGHDVLRNEYEHLIREREQLYTERGRVFGVKPTVYIKNLDVTTTDSELRVWFAQCGPIKDVRVQTDENGTSNSTAFVEFYYIASCEDACQRFDEKYRDKDSVYPLQVQFEKKFQKALQGYQQQRYKADDDDKNSAQKNNFTPNNHNNNNNNNNNNKGARTQNQSQPSPQNISSSPQQQQQQQQQQQRHSQPNQPNQPNLIRKPYQFSQTGPNGQLLSPSEQEISVRMYQELYNQNQRFLSTSAFALSSNNDDRMNSGERRRVIENDSVYIANLRFDITAEELSDGLKEFQGVVDVKVIDGKGFAFVAMTDVQSAKDLIALNGTISETLGRQSLPLLVQFKGQKR
jgi:RNA recognition motif-containing protein